MEKILVNAGHAEITEFLSKIPPFQFLGEEELEEVSNAVWVEDYQKDTLIHKEGGAPSSTLSIIRSGGVRISIRSDDEQDVTIDYRGEGDIFGFLSLTSGDRSRTTITTIDDTSCYQLGRDTVMALMDKHPQFTEFFLKSFFNRFIDKTFEEMKSKRLLLRGGDKLLFTTMVGELVKSEPVTAPVDITIREAALEMTERGISSLILVDREDIPLGIVTDRDLRSKVIARDRDSDEPVSNIMSTTLIKSESRSYCFEALLMMIRFGIHHLLIVENGRLKGIVTNHDFMALQGTSPLSIVHEIESQTDIEGLVPITKRINEIIFMLLQDGAKAESIISILTEVNDRLLRKVLQIAEKKFGPAPLPYCWIAYGSEGRGEQTFKTDQDNAIIFADPGNSGEARAAEEYFSRLSKFVNDSLVKCGFAPCPGDYMASNVKWRQPFSTWKKYFSEWIGTPTPEAILFSVIIFDFRPIYGDLSLAQKLREFVSREAAGHGIFLKQLAEMTVRVRPPLSFFSNFVVEKGGEHKDELNLKFKCIAPIINIVRLFALENGIEATSTIKRLKSLMSLKAIPLEYGEDLEQAFEFVMLLRIHHQLHQIRLGREPDNFIAPNNLSSLERKTLKEACKLISAVQDSIIKKYNPGMVL